ncbi:hypothetical protein BKA63DRAFT_499080 [Paraphoma chrysanthemicola]|nr:hypothetical protein BKA63DRAFT_499080 [Paraphoma chrysanthemicola]
MVASFRHAINNSFIDNFSGGRLIEVHELLPMVEFAFAIIPANRPLLPYVVDYYCNCWRNCCETCADAVAKLPHAFTLRAMRRFAEMLEEVNKPELPKDCCYYEHADEAEILACGKLHMRYDEEKATGFFGDMTICANACRPQLESERESEITKETSSDDSNRDC